ncbi:MAG: hypothetical protein MUE39_01325 [Gammaproteobacteria bacterium]|jgi:hypothetical protein|nr:hypothetical protein [Gammaproteobacteria bacterium]
MRRRLLFTLALAPLAALAQSGQSLQFQEAPPPPGNLNLSVSESQLVERDLGQGKGLGNECQAMLQQLDGMKYEPLRRDALWQRYQNECQSGLNGAPRYVPPMPQ